MTVANTAALSGNMRLGEILVQKGVTTPDQVNIALLEQKKSKELLGKIMVRLGFATEAIIRDVIGGVIGQESADLNRVVADSEAISLIPKQLARRLKVLPVHFDSQGGQLTLAMVDTFDVVALDQLNAHLGGTAEIVPLLAGEAEIEKAIDQFYGFELSVDGILNEIETGEIDYQSLDAETDEYNQPIVRLVNALLSDAVKLGASDIHFEPEAGFIRFRYRIDGVLRQIRSLHKNYWSAIAVRLKVLADMDIAETRTPQDGRISLPLSGREIDFRVSTLPTVQGENIVLRVLDRQRGIVSLQGLGLQEDELDSLQQMLARPEGIILVTGPTGSGKTTTLYSILSHLNTEAVNIMTLEDPVEYPIAMIRQTSVNKTCHLDFANGIRSMMRQDPDIILVGEIRDEPTAGMALRAAMTGHQVFSTLHTNSAIGAIPRLLDIGVKPDILAGNIIGVVAQRLVRKLCQSCKQACAPTEQERELLGVEDTDKQPVIYQPAGCAECEKQGYRGRMSLLEVLNFDSDLDELVAQRATPRELGRMALAKGFRPLAEAGCLRVLQGMTSLEEVSRVVDLTVRRQG
ncbi:MAG: GspE/PulE family protein [Gammaproteobacteria bacterium]